MDRFNENFESRTLITNHYYIITIIYRRIFQPNPDSQLTKLNLDLAERSQRWVQAGYWEVEGWGSRVGSWEVPICRLYFHVFSTDTHWKLHWTWYLWRMATQPCSFACPAAVRIWLQGVIPHRWWVLCGRRGQTTEPPSGHLVYVFGICATAFQSLFSLFLGSIVTPFLTTIFAYFRCSKAIPFSGSIRHG